MCIGWELHVCVGSQRNQKVLDSPELKLQAVVTHPTSYRDSNLSVSGPILNH